MSQNVGSASTYTGSLGSSSDTDRMTINLAPGQYMSVTLSGDLGDPTLRIYDPLGNLVTQDVAAAGSGRSAQAYFGGGDGGTYTVEVVDGARSGGGDYTLSTTAILEPSQSILSILAAGGKRSDTSTPITVYFVPAGERSNVNLSGTSDDIISEGWTAEEIARAMAALETISNVADITFVITDNPNADFQLVLDRNEFSSNHLGFFYLPDVPSGSGPLMGAFNGSARSWTISGGLEFGGEGFGTLVHEFLHGLGLHHPHEDGALLGADTSFEDFGVNGLNQGIYSTMSYNNGWDGRPAAANYGNEAGPSALDIAALQALYGANTTYASLNDVYVLPDVNAQGTYWMAIWDTGGSDEIRYTGSRDTVIDLRPATIDFSEGGGGYISNAKGVSGGFTIAQGVVIEKATGGSGNDLLVGNDANNGLSGGGGADTLLGHRGADDLDGGDGNDLLDGGSFDDVLNGGAGSDLLLGGTGDDRLIGGTGSDTLLGGSGADRIEGSSSDNVMNGGSGADVLTGGSGNDRILGGSGNDQLTGNGGADILHGGLGSDVISGGAQNDRIIGGLGQDSLTGGTGADTFVFETASDSRLGSANRDIITDFDYAEGDRLDVSAFDGASFVGTGGFSGGANEIRYEVSGGDSHVFVDRDGDGVADMEIELLGVSSLSADVFIF